MKKSDIAVGVTYSTKSGNAARKVLCMGTQVDGLVRPRWYGNAENEPPVDAMLVQYEQVRGPGAGRSEIVYLDQFATWAAKVDAGGPVDGGKALAQMVIKALSDGAANLCDDDAAALVAASEAILAI